MLDLKTYMIDSITDRVATLDDDRAAILILRDFTRCLTRTEVGPDECYETLDDIKAYLTKATHQLQQLYGYVTEIQGQAKDIFPVSPPQ